MPDYRTFSASATALTVTIAIALLAAGCGGNDSSGEGSLDVVATTTQVADVVREVGGDQVNVTQILQPNTDPHEYEPRPSDVEAFASADVVFTNGGDLDAWSSQLVDESGSEAEVVELSAGIPVKLEGQGEDAGETDPHWWFDPTNVKAATGEVETALVDADPEGASEFEANATAYTSRITSLDQQIAKCFDQIPTGQRKMVTDHDAFGYLAGRYDIDVVGTVIPALTTQAEPSAGDLAELEQTIKDENVTAVFPESSVPKKLSEAVASDTGATTEYVLYGDTLGPEDSDGATYVGMMKANANNLMLGFTSGNTTCFD